MKMAGLDWELLFLETEDLFPKKSCFESNEKKCLEEIKKALFKNYNRSIIASPRSFINFIYILRLMTVHNQILLQNTFGDKICIFYGNS